jgi:hypothetical protein
MVRFCIEFYLNDLEIRKETEYIASTAHFCASLGHDIARVYTGDIGGLNV